VIAEATPFNYSAQVRGKSAIYLTVFNLKSEILKIHTGGGDKLRIQFASP
jgi:hypothetical protein